MTALLSCVLRVGLLSIALQSLAPAPLFPQAFVRDDSHDFRGVHALEVYGRDPDNFTTTINVPADFRIFKLRIKTGVGLGPDPSGTWWLNRVQVDADNDGTIEWTVQGESGEAIVPFSFPEPLDGVKESRE